MKPRGFSVMDKETLRATAASGGKAAQAAGTAHTFSSEEAQRWGSVGGLRSAEVRRAKRLAAEQAAIDAKP